MKRERLVIKVINVVFVHRGLSFIIRRCLSLSACDAATWQCRNTLQGFACVCDGVPGTDWTGISFFHWLKSLFTGGDVESVAMAAGSQVNNNRFSEVTADFQGTQSRDCGKKPRTGRWKRKPVCYHLSGLGVVVCQGRVWPLAAGENSRPTFTPTPSFVFMPISERFQRDKTKAHS